MPTTTAIDPNNSLRGQQLTADKVNATVTPGQSTYAPAGSVDNVTAQIIQGGGNQVDPGAYAASAQSAGGGSKLNHSIGAQSVMKNAMNAFNSQLAGMNIDFADQSDQLAKKTAAMGRTGSGLFNRDTGYISDRARASREGMLGNLSFTAAQTDAANRLQAQIEQGRLREQQEGRFANTNVANMQSANQLAGVNANNASRMAMSNQDVAARMMMANASNQLSADQGNQRIGADMNQFNARNQMMNDQFNIGNDMNSQITNAGNAFRERDFQHNAMLGERGYQDQLAQQAQNDLYNQMALFQQGFSGDPTGTMMNAGNSISNMASMYGANAGQANAGMAQGMQGLLQMMMMGGMPGQQAQQPQTFNTAGPSGQQVPSHVADQWVGGA